MKHMEFKEIFMMVKSAANGCTYSGVENYKLLESATEIYIAQMYVEAGKPYKFIPKHVDNGEASAGAAMLREDC